MKNDNAADGENADGGESEDLGNLGPKLQKIGEERAESAKDAQCVEPYGRANRADLVAIAQAQLQQDGGESNGGDDHDGERAEEGAASGEDDDESEGSAEEARGDDRPAPRLVGVDQGFRGRILRDLRDGAEGKVKPIVMAAFQVWLKAYPDTSLPLC